MPGIVPAGSLEAKKTEQQLIGWQRTGRQPATQQRIVRLPGGRAVVGQQAQRDADIGGQASYRLPGQSDGQLAARRYAAVEAGSEQTQAGRRTLRPRPQVPGWVSRFAHPLPGWQLAPGGPGDQLVARREIIAPALQRAGHVETVTGAEPRCDGRFGRRKEAVEIAALSFCVLEIPEGRQIAPVGQHRCPPLHRVCQHVRPVLMGRVVPLLREPTCVPTRLLQRQIRSPRQHNECRNPSGNGDAHGRRPTPGVIRGQTVTDEACADCPDQAKDTGDSRATEHGQHETGWQQERRLLTLPIRQHERDQHNVHQEERPEASRAPDREGDDRGGQEQAQWAESSFTSGPSRARRSAAAAQLAARHPCEAGAVSTSPDPFGPGRCNRSPTTTRHSHGKRQAGRACLRAPAATPRAAGHTGTAAREARRQQKITQRPQGAQRVIETLWPIAATQPEQEQQARQQKYRGAVIGGGQAEQQTERHQRPTG